MKKIFVTLLTTLNCAVFANDCDPSTCIPPKPSVCAFNAPFGIDLSCSWDVFVTGSFLYLEPLQENMSMGTLLFSEPGSVDQLAEASFNASQIDLENQYKPAFKLGAALKFHCDNWNIFAEYTWFDHTFTNSTGELTSPPENTINLFIRPNYLLVSVDPTTDPDNLESLDSKWNLDIDFADLQLSRSYFVGKSLAFRTFYGLRAAWISQKLSQSFSLFNLSDATTALINTKHKTTSWGIGPRTGIKLDWFFCDGFRFFGNANASLLYTEYTVRANENYQNTEDYIFGHRFNKTTIDCVRPEAELGLGLGWGDCFCCNTWYLDLEIGYNFISLWNQNMFVQETETHNISTWNPVEKNLYLHGLTATARLDF